MRKAFDKKLSDCVDADTVAKYGGAEPYRYECPRCWEEVHLCAADSQYKAAHFRHRSGNNNIECENYLGSRSTIISDALSRRNMRDNIEFYFSKSTKMFSIGIKFSADEITEYEQSAKYFQVRGADGAEPIISIPIKSSRFLPDVTEQIPIEMFSWEYYISFNNDSPQNKYELFRKKKNIVYPAIFKIQANRDDDTFRGKLVRTETLYTNTSYFIVFRFGYYPGKAFSSQKGVQVDEKIEFGTMNYDFIGVVTTFTEKTDRLKRDLANWNYTLEENELLTLLWPPSSQLDDSIKIKTKYAYIFSSFEMHAHGNINVNSKDLKKISNRLTMVTVKPKIKIYKKNAELMLVAHEQESNNYTELPVTYRIESEIKIMDDGFFMFNRSGVLPLSKGAIAIMTPNSEVRHYSNGYLNEIVAPPKMLEISGESLLQDALVYYKRSEPLNWDDFESLNLSPCAFQYIEDCKMAGLINSAAKFLIIEGLI